MLLGNDQGMPAAPERAAVGQMVGVRGRVGASASHALRCCCYAPSPNAPSYTALYHRCPPFAPARPPARLLQLRPAMPPLRGSVLLGAVTVLTSLGFLLIGFDNGLMGGLGDSLLRRRPPCLVDAD